jgi:pyrimidine-nucleoside phosphorylase
MSSFLMAIYFKSMDRKEISSLVNIMIESGSKLDFSDTTHFIADKHSTGGIGDKTSLILAPILGSLGIKIPMVAGRALAFTGGTIDKLESISGFQSKQKIKKFKSLVLKNNCAIVCQSNEICPADQEIYRLRDLTGTIPSYPLITSSIMSKKLSEGINALVLDIKIGNGAFIKTLKEGQKLAKMMRETGDNFNIKTDFIFSSMDQPLGKYAGLACEIKESIKTLSGNGPEDLLELTLKLGSKILIQSGIVDNFKHAIRVQKSVIKDGSALKSFKTMINNQGGDFDNFKKLNQPKYTNYITA